MVSYFLGANSPSGFYSLYDTFADPVAQRLLILKSGPGSGKSTFMNIIAQKAEERGFFVERIFCSGDPDSLDGIMVPEKGFAIVDGTSPHVTEPRYAGSGDLYVDLNRFYRPADLRESHGDIMEFTKAYKAQYQRAYKLISALGAAEDALSPALPEKEFKRAVERLPGIISREMPPLPGTGKEKKRFLSALTCKGPRCQWETVQDTCSRVYVLDSKLGAAHKLLDVLSEAAKSRGYDIVRCLSPMHPDRTEHLLIPNLSLGFVSENELLPYPGPVYRRLRIDRVKAKSDAAAIRRALKDMEPVVTPLREKAIEALHMAKELHDDLEKLYNPHVDFEGVRRCAKEAAEKLLSM